MGIRLDQKNMTAAQWSDFIAAIDGLHGAGAAAPAYRQFVALHVQAMDGSHMDWSVHSMGTMRGKYFLAWHRRFIKMFEERLQMVNPSVTLPYWDSITDRSIPAALNTQALLSRWTVTRNWDPSHLGSPQDLNAVKTYSGTFIGFQSLLEGAVHGGTHNAVGGDMAGPSSPIDPLFWLHHAFMDKIWADWQASPKGKNPPSTATKLKPADMAPGIPFGVKISSLLSINSLGYSYS